MSEFTSTGVQINPSSAHRTKVQLAAQDRLQTFAELDNLRLAMKGPAVTFEKSSIEIMGGDSKKADGTSGKRAVILI